MREVERKFLLNRLPVERYDFALITQGYLVNNDGVTMRVEFVDRKESGRGTDVNLAIKSPRSGLDREEVEFEISEKLGTKLLWAAGTQKISKVWSKVNFADKVWEIDDYLDYNFGLKIAEVELDDPSEEILIPAWAGEEVTNDFRYTNANLATRPFTTWR